MRRRWTRRGFLAASAAGIAAAPGWVARAAAGSGDAPVGIAVIGVGRRGGRILGALLRTPAARVIGVCETARDRLERALARAGARGTTAFSETLAWPEVEAIAIATPDNLHGPMAVEALKAGKRVYLELPVGLSDDEIDAVASAAKGGLVGCGAFEASLSHIPRWAEIPAGAIEGVRAVWSGPSPGGPWPCAGLERIPSLYVLLERILDTDRLRCLPDVEVARDANGRAAVARGRMTGTEPAVEFEIDVRGKHDGPAVQIAAKEARVVIDRAGFGFWPRSKGLRRCMGSAGDPVDRHIGDFLAAARAVRAPACDLGRGIRATRAALVVRARLAPR
ncbi:MAG: Gfo/Idh/MocA family oxidoreductase [Planctomycetes bacterium]|nr:Gfo/Idh/MocA family oxidoreductase [Planctomycetota bacterium]